MAHAFGHVALGRGRGGRLRVQNSIATLGRVAPTPARAAPRPRLARVDALGSSPARAGHTTSTRPPKIAAEPPTWSPRVCDAREERKLGGGRERELQQREERDGRRAEPTGHPRDDDVVVHGRAEDREEQRAGEGALESHQRAPPRAAARAVRAADERGRERRGGATRRPRRRGSPRGSARSSGRCATGWVAPLKVREHGADAASRRRRRGRRFKPPAAPPPTLARASAPSAPPATRSATPAALRGSRARGRAACGARSR